jgi:hypothetical protein
MADKGFNKSTVQFGAESLGPLRSINFEETCPQADVTGAGDASGTIVAGIPVPGVTVTIVGKLPATVLGAAKAALTVAWNDGGNVGSLGNVQVVRRSTSGQMNGEILSTVVFAPSAA